MEGKFGEGERFYGMNCIMGKTEHTSKLMIALDIVVLNLTQRKHSGINRETPVQRLLKLETHLDARIMYVPPLILR